MKEIEANKKAWGLIAEDHYKRFKQRLTDTTSLLNEIITEEIGDISGKKILHLQCNTGADSISLSRLGAKVTGVDFAKENIHYARKLAEDFNEDVRFIESDIMTLLDHHKETYDIIFTTEGVLGWLPDLNQWGKTISALLNPKGFFYINESHPFLMMLDEETFTTGPMRIKYPYWNKAPDKDDIIGGYASVGKKADNYYWMYTMSDIINALVLNGLAIDWMHENDTLGWTIGNMVEVKKGLYQHPDYKQRLPMQFSIKASHR
ncbi:MAG: class I SAM-dependent methyltransferase [Bacillota bacterium]